MFWIVVYRCPHNQDVLVPVSSFKLGENKEMIANIPPGDFSEAGISNMRRAEKETTSPSEKIMQHLFQALPFIIGFIILIVVAHYSSQMYGEAKDLMINAGDKCLESAKHVCSEICSGIMNKGTAP